MPCAGPSQNSRIVVTRRNPFSAFAINSGFPLIAPEDHKRLFPLYSRALTSCGPTPRSVHPRPPGYPRPRPPARKGLGHRKTLSTKCRPGARRRYAELAGYGSGCRLRAAISHHEPGRAARERVWSLTVQSSSNHTMPTSATPGPASSVAPRVTSVGLTRTDGSVTLHAKVRSRWDRPASAYLSASGLPSPYARSSMSLQRA